MTYALREARALTAHALAAPIARANGTHGTDSTGGAGITRRPGPRTGPRPGPCVPAILLLCVNAADDMDPRPQADMAPGPTAGLHAATRAARSADAGSADVSALPTCIPLCRAPACSVNVRMCLNRGRGSGGFVRRPEWGDVSGQAGAGSWPDGLGRQMVCGRAAVSRARLVGANKVYPSPGTRRLPETAAPLCAPDLAWLGYPHGVRSPRPARGQAISGSASRVPEGPGPRTGGAATPP